MFAYQQMESSEIQIRNGGGFIFLYEKGPSSKNMLYIYFLVNVSQKTSRRTKWGNIIDGEWKIVEILFIGRGLC